MKCKKKFFLIFQAIIYLPNCLFILLLSVDLCGRKTKYLPFKNFFLMDTTEQYTRNLYQLKVIHLNAFFHFFSYLYLLNERYVLKFYFLVYLVSLNFLSFLFLT